MSSTPNLTCLITYMVLDNLSVSRDHVLREGLPNSMSSLGLLSTVPKVCRVKWFDWYDVHCPKVYPTVSLVTAGFNVLLTRPPQLLSGDCQHMWLSIHITIKWLSTYITVRLLSTYITVKWLSTCITVRWLSTYITGKWLSTYITVR